MQKIAIVVSDISQSAGTERAVINFANGLVGKTDNQACIISVYSKSSDIPFYKIDHKVAILHLGYPYGESRAKRINAYFRLRKELKEIIRKNSIDIILGTIHAYNIVLSTLDGVKRIGCEHLNYDSCPSVVRPFRKAAYKKLDNIVLLTKQDAEHYGFLDKEKIRVIPNIASFERETPAKLSNHRIIMVGRFSPQKGYDILVDVISKIRDEMQDWIIEIYGQGEEKEAIKSTIEKKELENMIRLHSPVSDIRDKMMESSIYLMTSRNEGLPMVLIEAQTCGLPIVSFDCPEGPREIVTDGSDGFLIEGFDRDLLGNRLVALIQNEEKRKAFGMMAFENSSRFSSDIIMNQWNDLFSDIRGSK